MTQRRNQASALAAGLIGAGLDWLYPRRCIACEEETASLHSLCGACWRETRFIDAPACRRCGAPMAFAAPGAPASSCPSCHDRPARWRNARAAALYEGAARRLVLALKHGDRLEAARPMGRWMARAGADLLAPDPSGARPQLVPTPLHWRRRLARRANQSAELASAIARETGAEVAFDALRRIRATRRLDGLSPPQRAAALTGAIAVSPRWRSRLRGASLVLVDDVLTSGATLNACADALLGAGAARVDALVFARVERSAERFEPPLATA